MERGNKVGSPKAPKPDHLYETTSPAKIAPILSSIAAVGITPYPAAHKFRRRGKGSKRAASTSVPEFARLFAGERWIRSLGCFGLSKTTRVSAIFWRANKRVLSQVLFQKEGTKNPGWCGVLRGKASTIP